MSKNKGKIPTFISINNKGKCNGKPNTRPIPSSISSKILTEEYRANIRKSAYLGKKGYTIPKTELTEEDIAFLKEDLFLKPKVQGPQYGPTVEGAFPVYRENDKKMYLPRFYGIERYGYPTEIDSDIGAGLDIDLPFPNQLRDYQEKIIDVYMKHVLASGSASASTSANTLGSAKACTSGGILEVPCGFGKCLAINTPILMYDGSIQLVQDIKTGDLIMGDDSTPRTILTLARGKEQMYNVIDTESGDVYTVNESHILSLKTDTNEVVDMSILDYLSLEKNKRESLWGYRVPIDFPPIDERIPIEITPYALGYWLGSENDQHTVSESPIIAKFFKITVDNKYIPPHYKCNSRQVRLEILAGLIDSVDNCEYQIYINEQNQKLLDDVVFLAKSLGFRTKVCLCLNKPNIRTIQLYGSLSEIPSLYPRKRMKANENDNEPHLLKYKIRVEKTAEKSADYYGFEIDGNRRFVLGDFTVTHNTVMALKIVSLIKKKTLILVHKEFLMNQWVERIQEFLPNARVGRIQAQICDIADKDIVLGMIQTMYNKEFPAELYAQFGLTIIDEVHRIGSEEFSKTLLKTVTPLMLGISATVERKDGLTKLLYMFIGPKIYSERRVDEDPVCVRAIEYISQDPCFNETEYDFRGNPKYSTMISKLSEFGPRSDFIVKILKDLVHENTGVQIMVLCHNRCLLKYFYEAIHHQGFASTGYYVGGMKEAALKETEGKQIVLATYAMAAEALDIKTLSALVMASPKTDITQSVGRILRTRHDNPIIVDIVDRHEIFQNQWRQRKTFYRKCNYRIRSTDSIRYGGMNIDWKVDQTWTRTFEPKVSSIGSGPIDKDPSSSKCLIPMSCIDLDLDV